MGFDQYRLANKRTCVRCRVDDTPITGVERGPTGSRPKQASLAIHAGGIASCAELARIPCACIPMNGTSNPGSERIL